ncbi:MAG: hypothetical protein ACRDWY_07280 [Actinomycetes bacterium]
MPRRPVEVVLEVGAKRVFASAVRWPGWCRAAKDEAGALEALTAYARRYAVVAGRADVAFRPARTYEVVQRLPGDGTTDFGAPGTVAAADGSPLTAAEARRQVALLQASWAELDRLARVAPEVLRKGPRGGGRDRDAVVAHVVAAEQSYARKVGVRHKEPAAGDRAAVAAMRSDIVAVLTAARDGEPLVDRGWPARYALRRMTWHVLDHVWEIEDKSTP